MATLNIRFYKALLLRHKQHYNHPCVRNANIRRYALPILTCILLFSSVPIDARPVSYPGGWTLRHYLDWSRERYDVHYSPNASHSVGWVIENSRQHGYTSLSAQWNHVLHRKNSLRTQSNMYLYIMGGVATMDADLEPNASIGLVFDKESRRYLANYRMSAKYTGQFERDDFQHGARLGVAPYLGKTGDVHTWLMLDLAHRPQQDMHEEQFVWTPMIRIFKNSYLGEIGISSNGGSVFNFVARF